MASTWRLGHRPELDAIRGVAVLLVVVSHVFQSRYDAGGGAGVATFFALSGFLITSLLLEEDARAGHVNLPAFWARRARRLLPALGVLLSVIVLLGVAAGAGVTTLKRALPVVFYVENFARFSGDMGGLVGHAWSLAIEEQFYLLWPLVLVWLLRRRRRGVFRVAAAAALASLGLRLGLLAFGASPHVMYFGTGSNACLILAGCALAAWVHEHGAPRVNAALTLSAFGCLLSAGFYPSWPLNAAIVPPIAAGCAVVLIAAGAGSGIPAWACPAWLMLVGRKSYGIYLWHYPILGFVFRSVPGPPWLLVSACAVMTWLVVIASWRYVEEPFLRRRSLHASGEPAGLGRRVDPVR